MTNGILLKTSFWIISSKKQERNISLLLFVCASEINGLWKIIWTMSDEYMIIYTNNMDGKLTILPLFESRGVLDTTLCDKICQWPATVRWFSPGTPVSFINKTEHYDITEVLLNVSLNNKTLNLLSLQRYIPWKLKKKLQ